MSDTGDMLTREDIKAVKCPAHGEFCEAFRPFTPCRARIEKAILHKHERRIKANRTTCRQCLDGEWHVHLG